MPDSMDFVEHIRALLKRGALCAKRAVLKTNRRQRLLIAQLLQVAFVVFTSFGAGLLVGQLYGSWLLALIFVPVFVVLMRVDFDSREPGGSRRREARKNRYSGKSSESTLNKEETKSTSWSKEKLDRDAWKSEVGAPQVEKAWALFAGHIVQEFIYDSWYSSLTPDTEFPASVRALLNAEFGRLAKRAKKVNLMLLISQALDLIVEQVEIFRDTNEELRYGAKWSFEEASEELNEKMIRMQLRKDCNLHPSMRTGDGHYKVLKQLAEVAVTYLDPPVSGDKVLSKVVCRELLAGSVFRKIIQLCTCYNVQKWLIMVVDRRKPDGQHQDISRPSDEMRGVWAQEQKIEHFSQAEAILEQAIPDDDSEDGSDLGVTESSEVRHGSDGGSLRGSDSKRSAEMTESAARTGNVTSTTAQKVPKGVSMAPKCKFRGKPIATVVAAEIVNATGSFQRDFVVYSIRVGDDRGEWTVSRRFRHFEQLHRALRSQNLENFDAGLPSKRYFFRDFTPQYVEARRVALNEYLQRILGDPAIYSSEFVWEFLKKRSERFQVTKNGDTVGSLVKHHFDNVVSATVEATRIGQSVGKGVGKGVGRGVSRGVMKVGKAGKGAKDYLFSGCSRSSDTPQSMEATDLHLMEDEINLGMPGRRISPAYFSVEFSATDRSSFDVDADAESDTDFDIDDDDDMLELLLQPTQSVAGSLYEFLDCVFRLQDRGFFRRQMFALYRRLVRLLFGNGIDEVAGGYIADLKEPVTIAKIIAKLQSFLWPGGKFVRSEGGNHQEVTVEKYLEPLPSPPDDYGEVKRRLRDALQDGPASVLARLVGRMAFFSGVDDLCAILSSQTMVTQISYGLLELVLEHLFEGQDANESSGAEEGEGADE